MYFIIQTVKKYKKLNMLIAKIRDYISLNSKNVLLNLCQLNSKKSFDKIKK